MCLGAVHPFAIGVHYVARAGFDEVLAGAAADDVDLAQPGVADLVVAWPAEQEVGARAAHYEVIAAVALYPVVAEAPVEAGHVRPYVEAGVVCAGSAADQVVPRPTVHAIPATQAVERVAAAEALDHVGRIRADDGIGGVGPHEAGREAVPAVSPNNSAVATDRIVVLFMPGLLLCSVGCAGAGEPRRVLGPRRTSASRARSRVPSPRRMREPWRRPEAKRGDPGDRIRGTGGPPSRRRPLRAPCPRPRPSGRSSRPPACRSPPSVPFRGPFLNRRPQNAPGIGPPHHANYVIWQESGIGNVA